MRQRANLEINLEMNLRPTRSTFRGSGLRAEQRLQDFRAPPSSPCARTRGTHRGASSRLRRVRARPMGCLIAAAPRPCSPSGYEPERPPRRSEGRKPGPCDRKQRTPGHGPGVLCFWLQGQDLNLRPSGYEPDELPDCSTLRRRGGYRGKTFQMSTAFLVMRWDFQRAASSSRISDGR